MYCFASPHIVSVAAYADTKELKSSILQSDYIRNETLNRLSSLPSYSLKSLKWKNRYYDHFKNQVIKELR